MYKLKTKCFTASVSLFHGHTSYRVLLHTVIIMPLKSIIKLSIKITILAEIQFKIKPVIHFNIV